MARWTAATMVTSDVSRVMNTRVADPALRREVEAAVRRRVAQGSIEPVMLREYDLPRS